MKKAILLFAAMMLLADAISASTIITQEVPHVSYYVKGSTTLKLKGTLSDSTMEALSNGEKVSIQNNLTNYLCAPIQLDKNDKGYGKKTGPQNISVKSKTGKLTWTEKDLTQNISFAIGDKIIKPTKATLKSSGTLQKKDLAGFETKKVTLFDVLGDLNDCTFIPDRKGSNFAYSSKGQDVQVKFTANAKGKANVSYKLSLFAVSPAAISKNIYEDPFSVTNKLYMVIDLINLSKGENFISYLDDVPEGGWTEEYKTTKLVLRKIEPGTFTMGSPANELGRYDNETQHKVTLTKAYYIGIFEMTQKQYKLIMGSNPNPSCYHGDARPVERVSYNMLRETRKGAGWPTDNDVDANSFFGILRAKIGLVFDLPTEAQWEFACRAGTTTALNSGKNLSGTGSCTNLAEVGRYYYNQNDGKGGYGQHTTVGSYLPNAWGLYDMHGNVYEWCLDWYQGDLGSGAVTEPRGLSWGAYRVLRGGSWNYYADRCRSAYRDYDLPKYADDFYYGDDCGGFRVVLVQNVFSEPDNQIQKDFEFEIESGTENTLPIFQTKFYGKMKNGTEKTLDDMGKLEYDGASGIVAGIGKHHLTWIPDNAYTNIMDEVELRVEYEDVTEQAVYLVLDTTNNKMRVSPEGPDTAGDKCRTDELWLRRIEPGTFTMGSPANELGRFFDETQHKVTLTKAYYIGVFEMTQKQCENIMGINPSYNKGDARPVEYVSYNMLRGTKNGSFWPKNNEVDKNSFMGQLRKKAGNIFDLPTEAQWEFACRAGTTTALNSGKDLSDECECDEMAEVGRYGYNQNDGKGGYSQHTTVGSYLPNAWGLYDMHGNVYEWCLDWYGSYGGNATDPKGASSGSSRVLRGGGWSSLDRASCCRSASRYSYHPEYAYGSYRYGDRGTGGFRVVLVQ